MTSRTRSLPRVLPILTALALGACTADDLVSAEGDDDESSAGDDESSSDDGSDLDDDIDDDPSVRKALDSLLRSVGLRVELFASAAEFMQIAPPDAPGCLVLDVRMPGLSGPDFQAGLAAANIHIPIIWVALLRSSRQ